MGATGSAGAAVSQHLKEARMNEHLAAASERGKEYGTKGWGILKSAYATVASQVENVARDNGYRVDLGEPCTAASKNGSAVAVVGNLGSVF